MDNTTNNDGFYGIAVNFGSPGGNFFSRDTAFGNSRFDLFQGEPGGVNINENNRCGTASPSKQYWDCRSGDGDNGGGDNGGGDNGGGGDAGAHHAVAT